MKGRVWLPRGGLVEEIGIRSLVFERDRKWGEGDVKRSKEAAAIKS